MKSFGIKQNIGSPSMYLRLAISEHNRLSKKKSVQKFGTMRGFCAEMIGTIKRFMVCLNQEIGLYLYSPADDNRYLAWSDLFEDFFPYSNNTVLKYFNKSNFPYGRKLPILKPLSRIILKATTKYDLFMFDDLGLLPERLVIPELNIDLDYDEACRLLIQSIWMLKPEIREYIENKKQQLALPAEYDAVHIRRGDKINEHDYKHVKNYVKSIEKKRSEIFTSTLFVASDDFAVIKELETLLPGINILTFCAENSAGYDQKQFTKLSLNERLKHLKDFIAELEILMSSRNVFASSTSNVGIFVRMARAKQGYIEV
jgi:hypothetical protein